MIHARADYQRIQDPAGLIPAEEPVFLLRAQDKTAPDAVEQWARLQYSAKGNRDLAALAMVHADHMRIWQAQHPERVKIADAPRELSSNPEQADRVAAEKLAEATEALARRLVVLGERAQTKVYGDVYAPVTWERMDDRDRQTMLEVARGLLAGES